MKTLKRILKILALAVGSIALLLLATRFFMSEGSLPSQDEVVNHKDEILFFSKNNTGKSISEKFSGLNTIKFDGGVLIIYKKFWVEGYGYIFTENKNVSIPQHFKPFSKEVAPGIFYYYNPG